MKIPAIEYLTVSSSVFPSQAFKKPTTSITASPDKPKFLSYALVFIKNPFLQKNGKARMAQL